MKRTEKRKEAQINLLFAVVIGCYILVALGLDLLQAAGVVLRLPLVLALVMGELTLLVPTVIYVLGKRIPLRESSQRRHLPLVSVPLLILMAYCILPLVSLVNMISILIAGENAVSDMLNHLQQLPMAVSLLCVSVLPGLVEEFIFRGLLYGKHRRIGVWSAILTNGLLFGLMHMNLNQFCYAFVMGVIFCLVYEATGSLLAPMLMHMVYNGNSVVMTYLVSSEEMAAAQEAAASGQLFGAEVSADQTIMALLVLAIFALVGLAAAGGLYVAVIKLCHREEYVKLLFTGNALKKRRMLLKESKTPKQIEGLEEFIGAERIWGIRLWIGVLLATGMILWDWLWLHMT